VIVLAVCIVVLLSLAYVYMPPEDRTHTPAYLRWMQARHLDHSVEAGNFRLHYLHEGSREAVILLPGGGVWIYDLRDVIAALVPHYAVCAIDEPGDGYTTPLAWNRSQSHGSIRAPQESHRPAQPHGYNSAPSALQMNHGEHQHAQFGQVHLGVTAGNNARFLHFTYPLGD
jgi:hypothetical protein